MSESFSTTVARLGKQALESGDPKRAVKTLSVLVIAAEQIETARYRRITNGGRLVLPDYRAFVRTHTCMICEDKTQPCISHHFGRAGVGKKSDDYFTVPLCQSCHETIHRTGENDWIIPFWRRAMEILIEWFMKEETEEVI